MARTGLLLALVGCLVAVGAWASAQAQQTPMVFSGNDLGFQVESQRGGTSIGKLVVRIDGKWVEAKFSAGVNRLGSK